jgi:CheY-like chemotaxis protein
MFADDDPILLRESSDALRDAGYKVIEVADGRAALEEVLGRRKVDLIVMDISMPEVGGVEACHCLKAMPKTQKIPIVLTAHKKDPQTKTMGERTHGSVHVLRKPFTPEDLVSLAKSLVKPNGRPGSRLLSRV